MNPIDLQIYLDVKASSIILNREDPVDFLNTFQGDVIAYEGPDRRKLAGRFRVIQVDLEGALEDGLMMIEALDALQEVEECSRLFDLIRQEFTQEVMELCQDELFTRNLLIIDSLEVLPAFRGLGLGKGVMRGLLQRFRGNAGLAVLQVQPLQFAKDTGDSKAMAWRRRMGLQKFIQGKVKAARALGDYYEEMGFLHLRRSPLMIANLAWRLP